MDVFKNLIHSEKAVAVGLLMIAATVLTAMGSMSVAEWREYTTWLAGIYVAGKTIQGGVDALATAKVDAAQASASATVDASQVSPDVLDLIKSLVVKAAGPDGPTPTSVSTEKVS